MEVGGGTMTLVSMGIPCCRFAPASPSFRRGGKGGCFGDGGDFAHFGVAVRSEYLGDDVGHDVVGEAVGYFVF